LTNTVRKLESGDYFIVEKPIRRIFKYHHDDEGAFSFTLVGDIVE